MEKADELAKKLNAKIKLIKGAGHFNINSGYTEFEELLNLIKKQDDF
jgi:predicted alpha/beta hydrolase family esterase